MQENKHNFIIGLCDNPVIEEVASHRAHHGKNAGGVPEKQEGPPEKPLVLLAFQPREAQTAVLERYQLVQKTAYTITDPDDFRECLETCRKQQWAAAYEENHLDHCDLGVPVFDNSGSCVAALAIVTDAESMEGCYPVSFSG